MTEHQTTMRPSFGRHSLLEEKSKNRSVTDGGSNVHTVIESFRGNGPLITQSIPSSVLIKILFLSFLTKAPFKKHTRQFGMTGLCLDIAGRAPSARCCYIKRPGMNCYESPLCLWVEQI